jgi:heat shock protein HspQ
VAAAKAGVAKTASPPTTSGKAKQPAAPAEAPVARPRLRRRAVDKRSSTVSSARFAVGDVVRHRFYPFRGVVFDIDPVFANTEEWWLSIPEQMRPKKNQPFYHLLAENAETEYIAYVSEQNLLPDTTGVPVRHPQISDYFVEDEDGRYRAVFMSMLN